MRKIIYTVIFIAFAVNSVQAQSDNPCEAPALNPGTECSYTIGNLPASATATTGMPAPGCANYNGKDVWYRVVVPASGAFTIDLGVATAAMNNMGMAWYAATTCTGPFTLIECDDNDSNNGQMPKIQRTGMVPGSTIWVRLWEHGGNANGDFRICAFSPQPCTGGSNNSCATAAPFCTGVPLNYCNTYDVPNMGHYACLTTTPNPMWLYLKIIAAGNLDILINQYDNDNELTDVDFALYGPFPDLTAACNSIGPNSAALDCSYSPSGNEAANIVNAQVGQYYMMLVTNYGNQQGNITFNQTGGNGATDCSIVMACTVSATMASDTCSRGVGKVTAVAGSGNAPYTYSWTTLGNQTTPTVNAVSAGVHSVTMTASDGCTATATVTVTNYTPSSTGTTTPSSCAQLNNGTATATMVPPLGIVTYQWNDPNAQTTQTATGLAPGTYICTMTSSRGCVITQSVTVSAIPVMVATITSQQNPICNGKNDGLISVSVTGGTAPYSYSWDHSASTGSTANDLLADTHTVTITDAAGCTVTQSATLIDPPALQMDFITSDSTICLGFSMNVTTTASGGKIPYTYAWLSGNSPAGSTQTISASSVIPATQYCVTITDACNASVDSCMTVSLPDSIVPAIVPNKTVDCQPAVFTFTNHSEPEDQIASTLFTFGNGLDTLVNDLGNVSSLYPNAGIYTVTITITSVYGCVYTDTFPNIVEAVAPPLAAFSISPNPATLFETTVKMVNNSSAESVFWNWSAPDATPISSSIEHPVFHFPEGIVGQYPIQLIVTTEEGCKDTVIHILHVESDIVFYAPNAFTPDGDEYNQRWKIYAQGIDLQDFEVVIFNRWGEIIWESHDPDESWDGTYGGNIVSDGTYTWKASVKDIHSDFKKDYHGSIAVIK